MPKLTDLVPLSSILPINKGLSSASASTMISVLGRPSGDIDAKDCYNDKASAKVKDLASSFRLEKVHASGIRPACESLNAVLSAVFTSHPELRPELISEGMLCVRLRRPTSHVPSHLPSNHSWGTAIDLTVRGYDAPGDLGDHVPYFIALLIPFFNSEGWFSGVGFSNHDDMHFEVADETIKRWADEGRFN